MNNENKEHIFPNKLYAIIGFNVTECEFVKQTGKQFAIYCWNWKRPISVYYHIDTNNYSYNAKDLYKTEKHALKQLQKECKKALKTIDKKLNKKK